MFLDGQLYQQLFLLLGNLLDDLLYLKRVLQQAANEALGKRKKEQKKRGSVIWNDNIASKIKAKNKK